MRLHHLKDYDMAASPLALASQIVAGFVSGNRVPINELPDLIREVHQTMSSLGTNPQSGPQPMAAPRRRVEPAVAPEKSVFNDYIICLEDGMKKKTLKRYLQRKFGLTPEQYRERWGLPASYPMTCPGYTKTRSNLAKEMGLGRGSSGRRGTRKHAAFAGL
jgi:predicted transcriptional regulator